jgi:hypothetical protein
VNELMRVKGSKMEGYLTPNADRDRSVMIEQIFPSLVEEGGCFADGDNTAEKIIQILLKQQKFRLSFALTPTTGFVAGDNIRDVNLSFVMKSALRIRARFLKEFETRKCDCPEMEFLNGIFSRRFWA